MGIINSKKNGLYAFIQPVKAPDGSVQVASALAPQQLLITQNVAYLNNSPIDTTGSIHPLSFQSPDFNGLMSGTKNGVARAATGYSRTMMVKGKPVVTNSTKKIINYGNCPSSPMVAATNSKTYAYIADNGGGNSGFKGKPGRQLTPEEIQAIQENSKRIQEEKQAQLNRCYNTPPTPAPKSILGKCQYYEWRNNDFIKRHEGCDHDSPPDYYLQYGLVFCRLFSNELAAKMDTYGKGWIDRTRLNLQVDMEAFLKANPTCELDNHKFYELAFQSHQKAYLDAGFLNLSEKDVVQFLDVHKFVETLVIPSGVRTMAFFQTFDLGKLYFETHNNSELGKVAGSAEEIAKEGYYLTGTLADSYVEWLHTHKIYYLDPFNQNLE